MTLTNKGEKWLDAWMQDNAFVTWVEHDEPWELEEELLHSLPLPLNIEGNMHYPFTPVLKTMRMQARSNARQNLVFKPQPWAVKLDILRMATGRGGRRPAERLGFGGVALQDIGTGHMLRGEIRCVLSAMVQRA